METRITTFTLAIVLFLSFVFLIAAFRLIAKKEQSRSYSGAKFVMETEDCFGRNKMSA
ncbi:MAG TPA: hypothetical protein GXZ32_01945 [Clostridiales bacterium]|nr:hypothetical protein [Clostridiales bacterium]